MTKREKIIIGAMAAAAVVALADVALRSGRPKSPAAGSAGTLPTEQVATQVNTQLAALALTPEQRHLQDRIGRSWPADLFRRTPVDRPAGTAIVEIATTAALPAYSGYLRIGGRALGILDGTDYAEGDWTEDGTFQIIRLGPERAELLPRGQDATVLVPIDR